MLEILFIFLMFGVFGKLIWLAFKAAWGIAKVVLTIVFLPVILIALFVGGFAYIAVIAVLVIGLISLIKPKMI